MPVPDVTSSCVINTRTQSPPQYPTTNWKWPCVSHRAGTGWYYLGYPGKGIALASLVLLVCIFFIRITKVNTSPLGKATNSGNVKSQNQQEEDQDASLNSHITPKGRSPLGLTPIPETRSSLCSRLCFLWLTPLLCLSGKKALEKSDVWTIPDHNRAERVTTETQRLYSEFKVLLVAWF